MSVYVEHLFQCVKYLSTLNMMISVEGVVVCVWEVMENTTSAGTLTNFMVSVLGWN